MAKKRLGHAFAKRDRHLVRKLKESLEQIKRMDDRRTAATPTGTTAQLFKKAGSTDHTSKIDALITRCDQCLDAKLTTTAAKAASADSIF